MIVTRRKLGQLLSGAVGGRVFFPKPGTASPETFHVDKLLEEHPYEPALYQSRMYRADAVVSLLGVMVFSRAGVGSGFASYREGRRAGTVVSTARFAGGSFPQHAYNLNKLGYIEEVVISNESGPGEAAYFGFMTASPEESIGDAKRSIEANRRQVPYVAAEGHIRRDIFRSSKARFAFPGKLTWADRGVLLRQVRSTFYTSQPSEKDLPLEASGWPGTFLGCIAEAIRNHPARFEREYVYNAKQFHVKLDKTADPKNGAAFAAKHLTSRPEAVAQFRGVIQDHRTGKLTKFRLWTEEGGTLLLPIRIELQARSYLALAFEFDPALQADKELQEL